MANEIKIRITSDADVKGFKDVNKELKDTTTVAQVAERGVDKLDATLGDVGKTAARTKTDIDKLDRSIAVSTASLRQMASALADADNAADRVDIKKAMNKIQADINTSLKAKKILNVGDMIDTNPGPVFKKNLDTNLGNSFMSSAKNVASSVGPKVGMAIAGSIGTVIVSTLGTIIAAGASAGVIGGGIALVAKDPQIAQAAQTVGKRFVSSMEDEAKDAFKGPVLTSLGLLEQAGDRTAKKMGKAFNQLGPSLVPLTKDVVTATDRITDSIVRISGNSGPALDALGDSIVLISDGFGDFVDTVVDGSPDAADNLRTLAGVMADLLRVGGEVVSFVSKAPEYVIPFFGPIREHYRKVADESKKVADKQKILAEEMTFASEAARGERDALLDLANALKAQTDPVFGMIDAQERLKKAEDDYRDALGKGKSGKDDAEKALRDMAKASIDLEGKVGQLGDEFNGEMTPALEATLRAAGWAEDEIRALAEQFRGAKRDGDKFAKKYQAEAKVAGAVTARRVISTLVQEARAFEGTWTATMITNYKTFGKPGTPMGGYGGRAHGGIQGAASGRIGSGLTWVGESGPELASLPAGTTVHSAGDSRRMMQQAMSGGGGASELLVRAAPSAHRDLMSILVESLQFYVRTTAGGSVQKAFGRAGVSA